MISWVEDAKMTWTVFELSKSMDKYYGIRLAMVVIYNDESDIREENQNIG